MNREINKKEVRNSAISGAMAGLSDAMINYPWISLRIMYQSGQTLKFNPNCLYRGVMQYSLGITAITSLQSSINCVLKQKNNTNEYWKIYSAFFSGVGGALISTPSEHLILTQQKLKTGPVNASKNLFFEYGLQRLWTGYFPKSMRDGGYAVSMLWGQEAINDYLNRKCGGVWSYTGGFIAGIISSAVTQPFDVLSIKKQMSSRPEPLRKIIKKTYLEAGVKGFFPGFLFRTGSVISGILVMGKVKKNSEYFLNENDTKKNNSLKNINTLCHRGPGVRKI